MARHRLNRGAAAIAQTWSQNLAAAAASGKIAAGVANPSRDPTAAAIAQQATMVSNFNAAVSSGAWANALRASGQAGWQQGMVAKGIPRLQALPPQAQQHYAAFLAQWAPAVQGQVNSLPARGTFAQNMTRSSQLITWMHSQRGRYRRLWRQGALGAGAMMAGAGG